GSLAVSYSVVLPSINIKQKILLLFFMFFFKTHFSLPQLFRSLKVSQKKLSAIGHNHPEFATIIYTT
ncbi:MAG: hypothetical protein ABI204_03715, partial [Ginsengibacter sp.]